MDKQKPGYSTKLAHLEDLIERIFEEDDRALGGQAERQTALLIAVEQAQFRRAGLGHAQVEPDRPVLVDEVQVGYAVVGDEDSGS